jgi:hypothetical protein
VQYAATLQRAHTRGFFSFDPQTLQCSPGLRQ